MSSGSQKRSIEEHRRDTEARAENPRLPIHLIADNIRSMHNVGSIFRTADGFRIEKLYLTGYSATPPRPEISKTAIGAEETVPFASRSDPGVFVKALQMRGIPVFALEQTRSSLSIYEFEFPNPVALVVGNEIEGVRQEALRFVDGSVEIPMLGAKHSHNVAVAVGILLSEIYRQWT